MLNSDPNCDEKCEAMAKVLLLHHTLCIHMCIRIYVWNPRACFGKPRVSKHGTCFSSCSCRTNKTTFLNFNSRTAPRKVGSLSLSGNHIKQLPPDVFKPMLQLKQARHMAGHPNLAASVDCRLVTVPRNSANFQNFGWLRHNKKLCFKKAASSIWFTCHSLTLFWTKKQRKKGETPAALEEAPLKVVHPNKGWNISSTKSSFFSLFASFSVFVFSLDLVDLLCVFFSRKDELLTDSADPANCQTQLLSASVDDSMTDDVIVESDHVEATAGPMGHRPWKNCPESFFLWTDGDTCANCIIR